MPETSFRRLAMADLDGVALRRLIDEGETLFVERKQAIPSESLGPTVASFANALGGWVLLGVAYDKTIHGYMATGDFVDHLRQTLRAELDPLPPFAAEMVEIDGKEIGVVRVFESADTPHIVIGTGSVYVREPGGKRPIESHGELVQLARRGEKAREKAAHRLRTLPCLGAAQRTRAASGVFGTLLPDSPSAHSSGRSANPPRDLRRSGSVPQDRDRRLRARQRGLPRQRPC